MCHFPIRLQQAAGSAAVQEKEPMSRHTTFQTGGPADYFVEPEDVSSLTAMLQACRQADIPYYIMGKGSNLLVGDKGYRGVIFRIGEKMAACQIDGRRIYAEAGITLTALARNACTAGLSGLEFAAGIPGTLGGAVTMNAGAYGGEMKDFLTAVHVLTPAGEARWIPAEQLALGYRTSAVVSRNFIVLAAELALQEGFTEEIRVRMADYAARRREKQPLEYPCAGSTFKRPEGHFAGKLIQDAGLSGYTVGGACISEKHCGFVINKGGATSADILGVCRHAAEVVADRFQITLEMEVKKLGEF